MSPALLLRRAAPGALAAALALAAGACAARTTAAGAAGADAGEGTRSARLVSQVTPPVDGSATLTPASGGALHAQIRLQGSPSANRAYPWRIFTGACGVRGGTILGRAVDYPIIQMQANGIGEAEARLENERPGGAVHVRVYASSTNATIVACGDFRS